VCVCVVVYVCAVCFNECMCRPPAQHTWTTNTPHTDTTHTHHTHKHTHTHTYMYSPCSYLCPLAPSPPLFINLFLFCFLYFFKHYSFYFIITQFILFLLLYIFIKFSFIYISPISSVLISLLPPPPPLPHASTHTNSPCRLEMVALMCL
jgi:hypothetical protein